jgi:hypothetical protein
MKRNVHTKRKKTRNYSRENELTIEELRVYPLFARFGDEQALEVIDTIRRFMEITFEFFLPKK